MSAGSLLRDAEVAGHISDIADIDVTRDQLIYLGRAELTGRSGSRRLRDCDENAWVYGESRIQGLALGGTTRFAGAGITPHKETARTIAVRKSPDERSS